MDREANQESPSLLSNKISNNNKQESSHRKPQAATTASTAAGGGDRLKRDEWSEGAVSTLLEAYEAKWILRNRAKLKGQDWEDVAKYVSQRANSTKTSKTQTQCKNKIESMKKRYRSESATADTSSWPLYPRLDLLLRGNAPPKQLLPQPPTQTGARPTSAPPLEAPQEAPPALQEQQPPPPPTTMPVENIAQNSHGSNGLDGVAKEDGDRVGTKLSDQGSDKNQIETESSTPALYSDKEKLKSKNFKTRKTGHQKKKKKQRCEDIMDVAESIRWLAEVIMRSEQARLDTMKELEKMRAEAEAKRGEMDLKRTEIIANTQLEIAKLFAGMGKGGVDSSLKIG